MCVYSLFIGNIMHIVFFPISTLFHPRGVYMNPLDFLKIIPKRLLLRLWNFVSVSSYLIDAFLKKFPVNDITASYDDVITKTSGANFTVKSLINWKTNDILIKSHLGKICTWNFDRMLFIRWGIHYKRKKLFSIRYLSSFCCSLLF